MNLWHLICPPARRSVHGPKPYTASAIDKFWEQIEFEAETGCWKWTGRTRMTQDFMFYGYVVHFFGEKISAHRLSYFLFRGELTKGMVVMHMCDNSECVNPAHLELGTQAENVADMRAKGRGNRGERNGFAKLTPEQVIEIRAATGTYESIGKRYGVRHGTVGFIKRGETWKHLQ